MKIQKNKFTGPLGELIKKHFELRMSLGRVVRQDERMMRKFDLFLKENSPRTKTITRKIIDSYLKSNSHLSPLTKKTELVYIRQFCFFLFRRNIDVFIPDMSMVPKGQRRVKPYIYTIREIKLIMQAALKNRRGSRKLLPYVYSTLIGLMWTTGLRVCELIALNVGDVDFKNKILLIRNTKFYKSRNVPIAESTSIALEGYLKKRKQLGHDNNHNSPLFVSLYKTRLGYRTLQERFIRFRRSIGIKDLKTGGPRLYDLRHSFATRSLINIYDKGQDPNVYLPILSTYMGHVKIEDTAQYLHPNLFLLEQASTRFINYVKSEEL